MENDVDTHRPAIRGHPYRQGKTPLRRAAPPTNSGPQKILAPDPAANSSREDRTSQSVQGVACAAPVAGRSTTVLIEADAIAALLSLSRNLAAEIGELGAPASQP